MTNNNQDDITKDLRHKIKQWSEFENKADQNSYFTTLGCIVILIFLNLFKNGDIDPQIIAIFMSGLSSSQFYKYKSTHKKVYLLLTVFYIIITFASLVWFMYD